eukprot:1391330-Pleurochrysis_carterae.AAC.1
MRSANTENIYFTRTGEQDQKRHNHHLIGRSLQQPTARIEDNDAKYLLSASDERKYGKGKR